MAVNQEEEDTNDRKNQDPIKKEKRLGKNEPIVNNLVYEYNIDMSHNIHHHVRKSSKKLLHLGNRVLAASNPLMRPLVRGVRKSAKFLHNKSRKMIGKGKGKGKKSRKHHN